VSDSEGRVLEVKEVFYSHCESGLPSLERMISVAHDIVRTALDLRKTPMQSGGEYPTLMDSKNHGVTWHEGLGHPLEAKRLDESDDSSYDTEVTHSETFKHKIGDKVTAEFITVIDDPTVPGYDGSYSFDQEGVRAQKVVLIENGVLKSYLHSRETAAKMGMQSNGHARSSNMREPIPRMSNLFVHSSNSFPEEALKEMLIKECERQGKEYGLMFKNVWGGQINIEDSLFNIFPRDIFRVYRDGSMQRVRGVYMLGTPFTILSNIIATGNTMDVFRGTCGAESGYVPGAEIAPSALFRSVEVSRFPPSAYSRVTEKVTPILDPKDF
jgi:predicted Zn-dependent protease